MNNFRLKKDEHIAMQGGIGSFHHIAVSEFFGETDAIVPRNFFVESISALLDEGCVCGSRASNGANAMLQIYRS